VETSDGQKGQTDHEQSGHGATIKSDAQRSQARTDGRLCRSRIGEHGNTHADVPGGKRTNRADHKSDRSRVVLIYKEQDEQDGGDGTNSDYLPLQVSLSAFLDRARNLAHSLVAGGGAHDGRD